MAGDIVFFPNARLIQSQSNYCSTKGVGGTSPNLSDAKTLDDGAVVPLGKPEEQQGSKVEQTKVICGAISNIVYNVDQIRMRYVVQVNLKFDHLIPLLQDKKYRKNLN
uniref:Poly [ADP-ribose] polymerase n=1 Tax=Populus trichocarpa TaxID=3694 RepID=A0A3N7GZR8_POPTR